ncbi:MAG: hypothetical protein OEY49_06230 [Candidatus Heimdallarchaeota archaeon]|nr:hypothetical protein [Candidatus Heimdallarchaeota archaeon]
MTKKIDVIIPADKGKVTPAHYIPLLEASGVDNKAFIDLAGKPMLYHVLEAVENAKFVNNIYITGLTESEIDFKFTKHVEYLPGGGDNTFDTLSSTIYYLLKKENPPEFICNITSDIPLITSEMIDNTIESIDWSLDADVYYTMISRKALYDKYPDVHKKPLSLTDGVFFGGDVHIFRPEAIIGRESYLRTLMERRKKFVGMARLMGPWNTFKFAFKKTSMRDITRKIWQLMGLKWAIVFAYPEFIMDLDYLDDLELFKTLCSDKSKLNDNLIKIDIVMPFTDFDSLKPKIKPL